MGEHRFGEILHSLRSEGRVAVATLATALSVSEETIRRDLAELERRSLLRRVHGGAVPPRLDQEQPLIERGKHNMRGKARVGELAETLLSEGMSIFLDTGTTTLAFARRLVGKNITVTTNSIDIALLLGQSLARVNLTPGTLRTKDNALVGYETIAYVGRYFYDMAFMGIGGCDIALGWMDYEEHESTLRQAMRGRARRRVMLADFGKFDRQAYLKTFGLEEPLTVVCDRPPPQNFRQEFALHEVDVLHP
ncbi:MULTISPECIES: DeoR/GlpR family DNA-binding transcription regulator [unclassified Rhizobium]|uniref:DeoR/GlpR family DNA-binding transcription regulator n=1 Tax=unclassified Rhizobium TaxID=2613769 RepID=UPI001AD9B6E7|nr:MULTISPECIES: DeoR/GlpR family DNA-binding transcription regulator [unclassified Rhizobium]MBO9099629.1 DeoR/GlpR transcriptional regulator [Rhizobium sp. L58/93]QXZ86901.1 DeoR/GlpR transcriptional regulator [Rhizobium sp. K1/93]QXZ93065.1 DeoR/GlpR transcriptional regulator [Rhizobium sp. K15/93]